LSSSRDAVAQAKFFLATIKPLGTLILPPSLDLEWDAGPMRDDCPTDAVIKIRKRADEVIIRCDRWGFVSSDSIISRLNAWIDLVKDQTQREPLLYTSAAWWRARVGKKNRMSEIHARLFWVADYSSQGLATEEPGVPPRASRTLWQFTDGASLPIGDDTAHLEASIFDGSVSDFNKIFHAN
jgi:lysozyme